MPLEPWNPWEEIERLQAQTNRLWEELLAKLRAARVEHRQIMFVPTTDLIETSHEYRAYLSLPGLVEEDMDLLLQDTVLIIRGERQSPYDRQHVRSRLVEERYGQFERRIEFSGPVELSTLRATYDDGVLTIVVRKQGARSQHGS